ncbi:MAG: hypothetical protein L6R39_004159 [Caloplaca ligustica]|nr:MAG: hypothetical protein L6R39_004159 [Caloplaca ligustica]
MPQSGDATVYTHPHNYVNPPSTAWMATTADSVGLALAIIVVAARCWTKFRITKAPGWEDYFSIMALATFITYWALNLLQRFRYGGGRHLYDIPPSMYYGYFWVGVVRGYLYILGSTLAKLSLLLFLYRIFRIDLTFRILSWILGAILTIWTTVSLLLCIFACRPIKASWVLSVQLDPRTKCPIKAYEVNNIHGICNIITDFALLIMPAPLVWKLNANAKKKLGLVVVFGTGIFICAVAIVRQDINYHTDKNGDDYYLGRLRVWFSLEFSFSIIVASLPVITPLLKKTTILATWIPALRTRLGASSGRQHDLGTWPKSNGNDLGPWPTQDIERGAPNGRNQDPPSSWKVPAAWKEPGERSLGEHDDDSLGSNVTLQHLRANGAQQESHTVRMKE